MKTVRHQFTHKVVIHVEPGETWIFNGTEWQGDVPKGILYPLVPVTDMKYPWPSLLTGSLEITSPGQAWWSVTEQEG